jgi:transposase-like protein
MHWPIQPVENQRRFAPPFCAHRACLEHRQHDPKRFAYKRNGSYTRRGDRRRVPRYVCHGCHRSFSKQSFSTTYFMKRPELLVPVAQGLVNGAADRQIARSVGCAPSTVTRLSARLGRHAQLLQVLALLELPSYDTEDTILDHTESFEGTQDQPIAIGTLVGRGSWFVYGIDANRHRRTGRRSTFQELRRQGRPERDSLGGYEGSAARLFELRLRFGPRRSRLRVITDDQESYARAIRRRGLDSRVEHVIVPNPERGPKGSPRSPGAAARDRAMFANDLLHGLFRHCLAHHHRETIAFPRRIVAALDRVFLFCSWRNFIKGVSERKPDPTTPAMRKGLTREPWSWSRLLARRLFPGRLPVPDSWREIYRRDWTTPTLPSNTRHRLQLAF